MKKITIAIVFIIFIFIGTTISVSFSLINSDNYLRNFNIISVDNVSTNFNITFEKVKAADSYEIILYNSDDTVFFSKKTNQNNVNLNLTNIENNKEYRIVIFALKNDGNSITVNNPYTFTYLEPTFSKDNSLIFKDKEDYSLLIDGDLTKKDYFLEISFDNKQIKKDIVKDNEYVINNKLFTGKTGIFTLKLYDKNTVINEMNIFSNMSPIKDLKIINPKKDATLKYKDINLMFEGGENATKYSLVIYKGESLIKKTNINKNNIIISSEFFNKGEKYTLKVIAYYEDIDKYEKSDKVEFTINDKETLDSPYINQNPLYSNGKINLINPNDSGTIYYTIDGKDPSINGIEYHEPFNINTNAVIKAIVIDNNKLKDNSNISTYNVNIGNKEKYKVYLRLDSNNENTEVLNQIIKNMDDTFKKYNIELIKDDGSDVNTSIASAKYNNVDLYLALKTGNSSSHDLKGFEIWINDENSLSYSLGNLIKNNFSSIYYENANRGLKYAYNSLDELGYNNVPLSILINLGYLDNKDDSKYLKENTLKVSESLTNSILKYFGLF